MIKWRWQNDPSDILANDTPYNLAAHKRQVRQLWERYPLNSEVACREHALKLLHQAFTPKAPWMVGGALHEFVKTIYTDENIYCLYSPDLEYRPYLEKMQARLSATCIETADKIMLEFLQRLISNLPASAFEDCRDLTDEISLPIFDLIPNLQGLPTALFIHFSQKFDDVHPVFPRLSNVLTENLCRASGIDPEKYDGHRPFKYSSDASGTLPEILDRYLTNTPFLDLLADHVPFKIPTSVFRAHGIIIAPPEHGKTQLFSSFIRRFLDEGLGMAVLDPHGDLYESLKGRTPPDRTILLDPNDPPPLNIFDFKDASPTHVMMTFNYLMSSLAGGLTDKQAGVAPYLLKLIQKIPNANLQTLLDIVRERPEKNQPSRFERYADMLDPDDANYFKLQFLGNKMIETKDAFAWKLAAAMGSDAFKAMFKTTRNSFDAYKAMNDRKIVLVKGGENVLGEHGLPVFMQLIVAQFFLAALKRQQIPEDQRSTFLIFADEAAHIFNAQTTRILTECRKYGLGFLAATQLIKLIPAEVMAAIHGATAIKISGPVQANDAVALAREMHTTADELRSLKPGPASAEWMVWYKGLDRSIKLAVPHGALNDLPFLGLPAKIATKPAVQIFKIGDVIQVLASGVERFNDGARVRKVLPDEQKLFVDGSDTGFLFKDCRYYTPPQSPPPPPPRQRQTPR